MTVPVIPSAIRRVKALSFVSAFTLMALTACGESRSAQCEKIGNVLNASSSQMLSASSTPQGFSQGATIANKAADDLAALELGDKKLSNLRSHLVASYRKSAEASNAMNSIAGPDGSVVIDASTNASAKAVMTQFETAMQDFGSVMNAAQTYCNGGTAPSNLTDAPAQ